MNTIRLSDNSVQVLLAALETQDNVIRTEEKTPERVREELQADCEYLQDALRTQSGVNHADLFGLR